MTMLNKLLPVAAILLLPFGCGTTDPVTVTPGHYRLESVGGSSLPATLFGGALVLDFEVMTLLSGGRAVVESVTRSIASGEPGPETTTVTEGAWSIEDSRLIVVLPTKHLEYRIEDGGRSLRLLTSRNTGGGDHQLDVFYELVYRRVP